MKNIFKFGVLLFALALTACETEMIERFDEFSFEHGAYMRTVRGNGASVISTTFSVSKANMTGTKMEQVLEAVTPNFGANFDRYEMTIAFVDATPANGNNSKPAQAFRTLASNQFTPDGQTKYPRFTLSVTGKEMMDALGLTVDQITAGDRFEFSARMFLKDGRVFDRTNTGANITGGAFYNSPFFYRANIAN